MTPEDWAKILGAILVSLGGLTVAVQRYGVTRSKDKTIEAGELAATSQFKNMQDAIESNRVEAAEARKETAELRLEFSRMDKTIHSQQRTITRMEMLLRQFSGLVQQHGIQVPTYMQGELDDLIVTNEEMADRRAK
jgi:small-conductance mechanosensitive channel